MPTPTDHPQPPPRSPFLPPAPRPQPPPSSPALQQRAWAGLTLALLSLLSMLLISNIQRAVYVIAVAFVVAAIALVLLISAMSAARRSSTRRPRGALLGTVLGVTGFVFGGFALAGLLLFSTQFTQYANCLNDAGSVAAAQAACRTQLNNSVGKAIGILGGN
jgi:uncharacterized membrane protein YfcA